MIFKNNFLLILLFMWCGIEAQNSFEIRYLGNMGVAIIHNDSTILIDGLHDFYETYYLPTDTTALKDIIQGQKPFQNIVAIAITHRHNDHFDSAVVTGVVNVHSSSKLFAGKQTRDLLAANLQRRFASPLDSGTVTINPNLSITLKKIPHVNLVRHAAIDNHRIEVVWNGFRIIHLGDAAILPEATKGLAVSPDVIIIPQWFLAKGAIQFLEKLRPVNVVVTHIEPSNTEIRKPVELRSVVTFFTSYGDKIILKSK